MTCYGPAILVRQKNLQMFRAQIAVHSFKETVWHGRQAEAPPGRRQQRMAYEHPSDVIAFLDDDARPARFFGFLTHRFFVKTLVQSVEIRVKPQAVMSEN